MLKYIQSYISFRLNEPSLGLVILEIIDLRWRCTLHSQHNSFQTDPEFGSMDVGDFQDSGAIESAPVTPVRGTGRKRGRPKGSGRGRAAKGPSPSPSPNPVIFVKPFLLFQNFKPSFFIQVLKINFTRNIIGWIIYFY